MLTAFSDDRIRQSSDERFEDAVGDTLDQIVLAICMKPRL
jgi:hypothetical protein